MKVFISYCQNNGGLHLANLASTSIENIQGNHCWFYDRDKTPGADKYEEIKYRITGWCDVVLFICTDGSHISLGQRDEIIFIGEWRIPVIPIRIGEATAPSSLSRDSFKYQDMNEDNFNEEFEGRIAQQLKKILHSQRTLEKKIFVKVE